MNLKKASTYGIGSESCTMPNLGTITKVGDKVTFTLTIEMDKVNSMHEAKRIVFGNHEKMKDVVKNVFRFCQQKLKEKDDEQNQM